MNILISAYACAPNRGSEHGSAWHWITEAARQGHNIWALVSPAHKASIEAACSGGSSPEIHWVFPALPYWRLQQATEPKWERTYNLLWQLAARGVARRLAKEISFAAIHHLTWGGIRAPTFLGSLGVPLIIGPVGGGEASPRLLRHSLPPKGRIMETLRDVSNATILANPLVRKGLFDAAIIFTRTSESRDVLGAQLRDRTFVLMEMGVSDDVIGNPRHQCRMPPKLLFAGRLIYWKGIHIAIEAMELLVQKLPGIVLTIVGNGPDEKRLRSQVARRKLEQHVIFRSSMPQDEFFRLYDSHDIFVFPSLHDSEGWVVLEAMCKGMPVVCLDLGGPKDIVTVTSGAVVNTSLQTTTQVAARFADQVFGIVTEPGRFAALSIGAIHRAGDFILSDRVTALYKKCIEHVGDIQNKAA